MSASIVVAMDKNRAIGNNGGLPWPHLSEDMVLFKERTLGHTVIMGTNTWKSLFDVPALRKLPIPHLPDRTNVIVTSAFESMTLQFMDTQVKMTEQGQPLPVFFVSLPVAMNIARKMTPEDCFVIGGGKLYKTFMDCGSCEPIDKLWVSKVDGEYEADTFFPPIDPEVWIITSERRYNRFNLLQYVRK